MFPGYVHHAAGVAARLAAVPDHEGAVPLPSQEALGLQTVDVAQAPGALVVMGQVLLVLHHGVLAVTHARGGGKADGVRMRR